MILPFKIMSKLIYILILLGLSQLSFAQEAAEKSSSKKIKLDYTIYADAYYAYFNRLNGEILQEVTTVSARHNSIGINMAQIGLHATADNLRSNIIFHAGDIVKATWDPNFSMVQEANVGAQLCNGLWLDAGFFATHIGTESFLPKNNFTSSTAVATFNEPFYQAGIRLSYEAINRLTAELWFLNGYNQFTDINSAKSVGVLLGYDFNDKISISYSNILGRESLDMADTAFFRTYHNLYFTVNATNKLDLIFGADVGTQHYNATEDFSEYMYNFLITANYKIAPRWSVTGRFERFEDPDGFISGAYELSAGDETGLNLNGYTFGISYIPHPNVYLTTEARLLTTSDDLAVFENTTSRTEVMFNMGFYLNKR